MFVNNMKRLPILIILLVIIIATIIAVIFMMSRSPDKKLAEIPVPTINPNLTPVPMRISFEPSTIRLKSAGVNKIEADITLNSGTNDTSGVDIAIVCDPKLVKNIKLTQKRDRYSSLSYAFDNATADINQADCTGNLLLSIPATAPEQRGKGVVAHFTAEVSGNIPTEIIIEQTSTAYTRSSETRFEVSRINLELTQ